MLSLLWKVGMRRLELPTSTSRTWRASQLCYIPISYVGNRLGYHPFRLRMQRYYLILNLQAFGEKYFIFRKYSPVEAWRRLGTGSGKRRLSLRGASDRPAKRRAYGRAASLCLRTGRRRSRPLSVRLRPSSATGAASRCPWPSAPSPRCLCMQELLPIRYSDRSALPLPEICPTHCPSAGSPPWPCRPVPDRFVHKTLCSAARRTPAAQPGNSLCCRKKQAPISATYRFGYSGKRSSSTSVGAGEGNSPTSTAAYGRARRNPTDAVRPQGHVHSSLFFLACIFWSSRASKTTL